MKAIRGSLAYVILLIYNFNIQAKGYIKYVNVHKYLVLRHISNSYHSCIA